MEPGCFTWCWRTWWRSQGELCWSGRVQAGCKACLKPRGLLWGWGRAPLQCRHLGHTLGWHCCSPHFPPHQLPRSLIFYSFHQVFFFFSEKRASCRCWFLVDMAASPPWVPVYTHFKCALESLSNSCYDSNQSPLLLPHGAGRMSQFFLPIPGSLSCDLGGDTHYIFHL